MRRGWKKKKSTFRAFASRAKKPKKVERNVARLKDALWVEPRFQLKSRANKPFAGKFAKD